MINVFSSVQYLIQFMLYCGISSFYDYFHLNFLIPLKFSYFSCACCQRFLKYENLFPCAFYDKGKHKFYIGNWIIFFREIHTEGKNNINDCWREKFSRRRIKTEMKFMRNSFCEEKWKDIFRKCSKKFSFIKFCVENRWKLRFI